MPASGNNNHPTNISWAKILDAFKEEAATKTTFFTLISLILTVIYAITFLIPIRLLPQEQQPLIIVIVTFVVAFTIHPLRAALEEMFRQMFPELDYDAREIVKRLNIISYSTLTLDNLTKKLLDELEVHLHIAESAFIIKSGHQEFEIKSHGIRETLVCNNTQIERMIKKSRNKPILLRHLQPGKTKDLLQSLHMEAVIPLHIDSAVVGLLLLGKKYTKEPHSLKDLRVLEAAAPKMAFALENALTYEQVKEKNQKLIDDLRSTNDELRQVNRELRHDDKLKDEFAYVATHELKNPVTAMKGYLSLIMEGEYGQIPDRMKPALDQINASNQQLIGLLNNLLQIARSEAQRLDISIKPITICHIIDEVLTDVKPLIEQKDLTPQHVCPNPSVAVLADTERLREVISNLVSNAIKYSQKGTVLITHEVKDDQFVTHIQDEGVGIAEKDQQKIFTRFFRVEEEAAKGIPGTGLGLFIIKDLIEKMHGKIWFKSEIGKGSTFSFSLPLARTYSLRSQ